MPDFIACDSPCYKAIAVESSPFGCSVFEQVGDDLRCLYSNREGLRISKEALRPGAMLCQVLPEHRLPAFPYNEPLIDIYLGAIAHQQATHRLIQFSGDVNGDWFELWLEPVGTGQCIIWYRDATTDQNAKFRDPLTGLYHRGAIAFLDERYESALFLDLDKFKAINDNLDLGHPVADKLLQAIAKELNKIADQCHGAALRMGGDEFMILLPNTDTEMVAISALQAVRQTYVGKAHCSASVGVAIAPQIDVAYHNAELACRIAKLQLGERAVDRVVSWTPQINEVVQRRYQVDTLMSRAPDERFRIEIQPIVNLETGAIVGGEVLFRPPGFAPDEAIASAERQGKIAQVTNWVLGQAIAALRAWENFEPDCWISINVSPRELEDHRFAPWFLQTISYEGMHTKQFKLEITERDLIGNPQEYEDSLTHLLQRNVAIDIDDFGAGNNGLTMFTRFPLVSALKLDRGILADSPDDKIRLAVCEASVVMARKLGLDVIAEGIETSRQVEAMRAIGVHLGQGYLFSKPLPLNEFVALLRNRAATASQ